MSSNGIGVFVGSGLGPKGVGCAWTCVVIPIAKVNMMDKDAKRMGAGMLESLVNRLSSG